MAFFGCTLASNKRHRPAKRRIDVLESRSGRINPVRERVDHNDNFDKPCRAQGVPDCPFCASQVNRAGSAWIQRLPQRHAFRAIVQQRATTVGIYIAERRWVGSTQRFLNRSRCIQPLRMWCDHIMRIPRHAKTCDTGTLFKTEPAYTVLARKQYHGHGFAKRRSTAHHVKWSSAVTTVRTKRNMLNKLAGSERVEGKHGDHIGESRGNCRSPKAKCVRSAGTSTRHQLNGRQRKSRACLSQRSLQRMSRPTGIVSCQIAKAACSDDQISLPKLGRRQTSQTSCQNSWQSDFPEDFCQRSDEPRACNCLDAWIGVGDRPQATVPGAQRLVQRRTVAKASPGVGMYDPCR